MSYEQDLEIDPQALDVEWLKQSNLFMKYSKLKANADRKADRSKQALDISKAVMDNKIRSNPKKYSKNKVDKMTEKMIQTIVDTSDSVKKANEKFIDAKYKASIFFSAVLAFNHRKTALENLVRLNSQEYFSAPKEPRNLKEKWEEEILERNAANKIKKAHKKKRRTTK